MCLKNVVFLNFGGSQWELPEKASACLAQPPEEEKRNTFDTVELMLCHSICIVLSANPCRLWSVFTTK